MSRRPRDDSRFESFVTWSVPNQIGTPPTARYAHSCNTVGSNLHFFGGFQGEYLNEHHMYNTDTLSWSQPTVTGVPPLGRAFHTSWVVGSSIFFFAGFNGTTNMCDLHVLDTDTMNWSLVNTTGASPSARFEHGTAVVGSKVYVFGGGNNRCWFNDVHMLDIETLVWSQPQITGCPPPGRCAHALCAVDNLIYLIGGFDGRHRLNDVWILDTESLSWSLVESTRPGVPVPGGSGGVLKEARAYLPPPGRAAHVAVYMLGYIVVFGGFDGKSRSNEIWLLDVDTHIWRKPLVYGNRPSARSYHSAAVVDDRVWVFGGYDGTERLGDLLVMEKTFPSLAELCRLCISKNKKRFDLRILPSDLQAQIPKKRIKNSNYL